MIEVKYIERESSIEKPKVRWAMNLSPEETTHIDTKSCERLEVKAIISSKKEMEEFKNIIERLSKGFKETTIEFKID